jgi:hypothetical protein
MLSTTVRGLFLTLLAMIAGLDAFSGELEQRRPRQSSNVSNGLDVLGLWQPESVRAILLLYSGRNLSKVKAEEFEAALRKSSDKVDERLVLIGYYSLNAKTAADRLRLRAHVLWMVENRPQHPATAEPSLRDLPEDAEGNAQILAVWRKNLEMRGDDLAVLKNAEKFFFAKDPALSEKLILRIFEQEPNNREWADELAQLYRMFGIPGQRFDDPAERAAESYKRVLALIRNSAARESLAGEMADAAFRMGDFRGAAVLAKIYLRGNDRTAPQRANTILGRVALRGGDLSGAKQYLLDSAGPAAGKDVSVSGPTMVLAKELLEEGEQQAVLQYLYACLTLWPRGESALQFWIADIESGKKPNFGNLGF